MQDSIILKPNFYDLNQYFRNIHLEVCISLAISLIEYKDDKKFYKSIFNRGHIYNPKLEYQYTNLFTELSAHYH